jgi:hypothetical protein
MGRPKLIDERMDRLVDYWCGGRHVDALRILLPNWPVANLTDEWARVLEALKAVRERASEDFTAAERSDLDEAIREVAKVVYRT